MAKGTKKSKAITPPTSQNQEGKERSAINDSIQGTSNKLPTSDRQGLEEHEAQSVVNEQTLREAEVSSNSSNALLGDGDRTVLQTADSDWQKDSLLLMACHVYASLTASGDKASETDQVLAKLVMGFTKAAELYYVTGIDELLRAEGLSPTFTPFKGGLRATVQSHQSERREIMTKISNEWARLLSIVSTARLLDSTTPASRLLKAIFRSARSDLRISSTTQDGIDFVVLPHFGRHFELVSFTYAPDIFLVGVPVGELYNPWRYGLIWHEMAGIYVRQHRDEKGGVIERLQELLYRLMREGTVWEQWKVDFDADLQGLPRGDDGYLTDYVLRNWAEELVEDAAGVLCLGEAMLISLRSVLDATYAKPQQATTLVKSSPDTEGPRFVDLRHPPAQLRTALAEHLLARFDYRPVDSPISYVEPLADLLAEVADLIVVKPLRYSEEELITQSLEELVTGNTSALDQRLGLRLAAEDGDLGDSRSIRYLVAAATRAFHGQQAKGDKIREILFNGIIKLAPALTVQPDTESPLFKQLHKSGFSHTDELYSYNVSCDGITATFSIGGWCGTSGHATMQGWGQAWHQ